MKRMTSNEYNPCFNCNFYSSCSHIRENFPVCPERARYDRLAAYEDTGLEPEDILRILDVYGRGMTLRTESAQRLEIVKGIQTDRLRELAEADRSRGKKIETVLPKSDAKDECLGGNNETPL